MLFSRNGRIGYTYYAEYGVVWQEHEQGYVQGLTHIYRVTGGSKPLHNIGRVPVGF